MRKKETIENASSEDELSDENFFDRVMELMELSGKSARQMLKDFSHDEYLTDASSFSEFVSDALKTERKIRKQLELNKNFYPGS